MPIPFPSLVPRAPEAEAVGSDEPAYCRLQVEHSAQKMVALSW
jgi:hypothetical protein